MKHKSRPQLKVCSYGSSLANCSFESVVLTPLVARVRAVFQMPRKWNSLPEACGSYSDRERYLRENLHAVYGSSGIRSRRDRSRFPFCGLIISTKDTLPWRWERKSGRSSRFWLSNPKRMQLVSTAFN